MERSSSFISGRPSSSDAARYWAAPAPPTAYCEWSSKSGYSALAAASWAHWPHLSADLDDSRKSSFCTRATADAYDISRSAFLPKLHCSNRSSRWNQLSYLRSPLRFRRLLTPRWSCACDYQDWYISSRSKYRPVAATAFLVVAWWSSNKLNLGLYRSMGSIGIIGSVCWAALSPTGGGSWPWFSSREGHIDCWWRCFRPRLFAFKFVLFTSTLFIDLINYLKYFNWCLHRMIDLAIQTLNFNLIDQIYFWCRILQCHLTCLFKYWVNLTRPIHYKAILNFTGRMQAKDDLALSCFLGGFSSSFNFGILSAHRLLMGQWWWVLFVTVFSFLGFYFWFWFGFFLLRVCLSLFMEFQVFILRFLSWYDKLIWGVGSNCFLLISNFTLKSFLD